MREDLIELLEKIKKGTYGLDEVLNTLKEKRSNKKVYLPGYYIPYDGEEVCYLNYKNQITSFKWNDSKIAMREKTMFGRGLLTKTVQEAQFIKDRQAAYADIVYEIAQLNGEANWIDWKDKDQEKWSLWYDHDLDGARFMPVMTYTVQDSPNIEVLKSEKLCYKLLKKFSIKELLFGLKGVKL